MKKYCFDPVIDSSCIALILGSMPSEESLRKNQYYGHKRNGFWMLLCDGLEKETYENRCGFLLEHKIALWDVVKCAERKGSLDSSIKNEEPNDFYAFLKQYPGIKRIYFNGTKAHDAFKKYFGDLYKTYDCTKLPSSSPAYTLRFEEKKRLWRSALNMQ